MSPQVAYLLARIAEDEAVARSATSGPWRVDDEDYAEGIYSTDDEVIGSLYIDHHVVSGGRWGGEASVFSSTEDALHIARWDPARVLAECKAKRLIVEEYVEAAHLSHRLQDEGSDEKWEWMARETALEHVVRIHTVPYADRDDFDPRWIS